MGKRLLIFALLAAAPRLAHTQAAPAPPACHVDTIGVDTTLDTLFAWVPGIEDDQTQAEHVFLVAQVQAVLGALRPLATLGKPDRLPRFDSDWRLGTTSLDGANALVWFQVRDNGRLSGMSVVNWSGWDSLDLALQRAILRADSMRTLRPLPSELAGRAVDLWLAIGTWHADAVADVPVAVVRRIGPRLRGAQERARLLSIGYQPQFPTGAVRAGVSDRLVVDFVIDTAGRVDPDSILFLRASFREFAQQVLRALRSARFAPARIGGCPVRTHVQQPINFLINYRR